MKVTARTVQTALKDLTLAGWIGTPFGDAGGSREGVVYHLHPDGKSCLFCTAAERTVNQRGRTQERHWTGEEISPLNFATGEIFDSTCKEYSSLSNLPKSSTAATPAAAPASTEPPEEFLQIMDAYVELDESALRRLWREARQIVPDASAEEVRHFFGERAQKVFRNRRVESPVGLLLSSIADWFVKRRVLQKREERHRTAEEYEILKRQLAEVEQKQSPPEQNPREARAQVIATLVPRERFDMTAAVRAAAARKALR